MATNQEILDALDEAILAMAAGTRVESLSFDSQTIKYPSLPQLEQMRRDVAARINQATPGRRRAPITPT